MPRGALASGPAIVDSNLATSAVVRPIGPLTLPYGMKPGSGTRPQEGRKPITLVKAGGLRSDPMLSDPSATGTIRAASAAAAPPLLPPAVRDGS